MNVVLPTANNNLLEKNLKDHFTKSKYHYSLMELIYNRIKY